MLILIDWVFCRGVSKYNSWLIGSIISHISNFHRILEDTILTFCINTLSQKSKTLFFFFLYNSIIENVNLNVSHAGFSYGYLEWLYSLSILTQFMKEGERKKLYFLSKGLYMYSASESMHDIEYHHKNSTQWNWSSLSPYWRKVPLFSKHSAQ